MELDEQSDQEANNLLASWLDRPITPPKFASLTARPTMEIPIIDVFLEDDTVGEVVNALVSVVRPEWDPAIISYKCLGGGQLNATILCCQNSDLPLDNALFIKSFREFYVGPTPILVKHYQFAHDNALGPRVLAFFKNGICTEYVNGEHMQWNSPRLREEAIWRKVAKEMARWHSRAMYRDAVESNVRQIPSYCCDIKKHWSAILEREPMIRHKGELPTLQEILHEEKIQVDDLIQNGEMEPALCHMDVNASNIILTKNGGVTFVDLDYIGLCYSQCDLALYFWTFVDASNISYDHVPGREYQMDFLTEYLTERHRLDSGTPTPPSLSQVTKLYNEVQKAHLMTSMRLIVGGTFVGDYSGNDLFVKFGKQLWREFHEEKRRFGLTT